MVTKRPERTLFSVSATSTRFGGVPADGRHRPYWDAASAYRVIGEYQHEDYWRQRKSSFINPSLTSVR